MRATAKFLGEIADGDDADDIAIFVAEELEDGGVALHLGVGAFLPLHGDVGGDLLVHEAFDLGDLGRSQGRAVRKVKPQPVRPDIGTLLGDGVAQNFPQRPVHQVRAGVVGFDARAAGFIDSKNNPLVRFLERRIWANVMINNLTR
jgi:hypothetical protein